MGLFGNSKKKTKETIEKYFKDKGISLEKDGKNYSFELVNQKEGFSLYPYFTYDEDVNELSFFINLKNVELEYDYRKLNSFNIGSKYFKAAIKDSIIYLEYNAKVEIDEFKNVMDCLIESVFIKSLEIDSL